MPGPTRTVNGETREWNGSAWVPMGAAPAQANSVPMYHPGLNDSPGDAFSGELERTAGEAGIGLAKSPLDLVKNTLGMVMHPLDTASGVAHTVMHPADSLKALEDNPREAGSLLGQLLLGHYAGPKVGPALEAAPGVVGNGMASVGRGMEAVGRSPMVNRVATFGGVGDLIYRGDPKGLAIAAAPTALQYGGRGLQSAGETLASLKRAAVEAPKPNSVLSGMTLSPEAVARNVEATNMRDVDGFSHAQAGKLSGIPGAGESSATDISVRNIPKKFSRPFPNLEPASSPEPAEEVGRSVLSSPSSSISGLKDAAAADAPPPDLMDNYLKSLEGGIGSGKQEFDMFGTHYVPDGIGSHVEARGTNLAAAAAPPEDLSLTPDPGGSASDLNEAAVSSGFARNNPIFRQMQDQGMFGGDRTSLVMPTLTDQSPLGRLKRLITSQYTENLDSPLR